MRTQLLARMALLVALTAVAAQLAVPLPSGIPFTLQPLVVLLTGLVLPPGAALLTQATYVLLGLLGLPVFARANAGLGTLAGPTGGYLVGFPLGAALTSLLARALAPEGRSAAGLLVAAVAGLLPVYALGVAWMAYGHGFGLPKALYTGVLPYIPLDLVKAAIAAGIARRIPRPPQG